MSEQFRRGRLGWIRSSDGYAIRLLGRTNLQIGNAHGRLRVSAEAMSVPWNDIVVYGDSIPDVPERPRAVVVDRIRRAFDFVGWHLILKD